MMSPAVHGIRAPSAVPMNGSITAARSDMLRRTHTAAHRPAKKCSAPNDSSDQ